MFFEILVIALLLLVVFALNKINDNILWAARRSNADNTDIVLLLWGIKATNIELIEK